MIPSAGTYIGERYQDIYDRLPKSIELDKFLPTIVKAISEDMVEYEKDDDEDEKDGPFEDNPDQMDYVDEFVEQLIERQTYNL